MNQKAFWIIVLLLLIAIGLMFLPRQVGASDGLPIGVVVFEAGDHTCVYVKGGTDIECFCPCEDECVTVVTEIEKKVIVEEKEKGKAKCNAGRGNGSELYWDGNKWVDCDPGNSGKNKGGD